MPSPGLVPTARLWESVPSMGEATAHPSSRQPGTGKEPGRRSVSDRKPLPPGRRRLPPRAEQAPQPQGRREALVAQPGKASRSQNLKPERPPRLGLYLQGARSVGASEPLPGTGRCPHGILGLRWGQGRNKPSGKSQGEMHWPNASAQHLSGSNVDLERTVHKMGRFCKCPYSSPAGIQTGIIWKADQALLRYPHRKCLSSDLLTGEGKRFRCKDVNQLPIQAAKPRDDLSSNGGLCT